MPTPAATSAAPPLEMIGAMTACAHALGLAASEIAKSAGDDTALFLAASAEFRHCFFAVRMGIRLSMAQAVTPGAARAAEPAQAQPEPPERPDWREDLRDRAETETETERERERDYEPVSLPQFLKTLGLAAAGADARRDALPADILDTTLPRLHSLLREAKAPPNRAGPGPGAAVAVFARPPATPAGRSRLMASTGGLGLPPNIAPATRRRDSG